MMCLKRIFFMGWITFSFFISTQLVFAQEPDYDRVNQIAKNMNCPTCVGVNLADCRTQTCEQWRGQIHDLIEQGYTDQEVLDYFAAQYGVQVLLEPPKEGQTLTLWVLPVVALLIGGGWLIYLLQRWKRASVAASAGPASSAGAQSPDNDYLKQVEKDLETN